MVPIELAYSPVPCPEYPAGDVPRVPTAPAAVTVRIPGYSIEIADGASEETIRNTLKALYFDQTGFVLCTKRLDNGKFQWPRSASEVRPLTRQQLRWLLEGLSLFH